MRKSRRRAELERHILDLAWSLWAELGVSGWARRHEDVAIDLEPLVLFTARLGDLDARLRDESTDWCIRYGQYVSKARLRNFLRDAAPSVLDRFAEFAATVNRFGTLQWPDDGARARTKSAPTGRSRLDDLGRPSLLALRLRAIFGVSARAEILRVFVARPDASFSASELAREVRYGKRNVADALESLRMGGLMRRAEVRYVARYSLAPRTALLDLLGARPSRFLPWPVLFDLLGGFLELFGRPEQRPVALLADAQRLLQRHESELAGLRVGVPTPRGVDPSAWSRVAEWALGLARDVADNAFAPGLATPSLARRRSRAG